MNQEPSRDDAPTFVVTTRTYIAFCLLSLSAIFLAQLQQGLVLTNALVTAFGALTVVARMRQGPVLFVLFLGAAQLVSQFMMQRFRMTGELRLLEVDQVMLCMGTLAFVAGHYRLQSLWSNVLVIDPRRRLEGQRVPFLRWLTKVPLQHIARPEAQIAVREITLLALSLPLWALVAQALLGLLTPQWTVLDLPLRLMRILLVLWALVIGLYLVTGSMSLWKRRTMSRESATLFLQDTLWRETRGEQRRIQRWLTWDKINKQ